MPSYGHWIYIPPPQTTRWCQTSLHSTTQTLAQLLSLFGSEFELRALYLLSRRFTT
jgi:hypothetical protein